ncbi:MAG: DUF697 domain-containing protein [Alphaproteobacteria bacterium]|nr:DUF697 domain-containing protein [Alphaproteobacteria bacterium]
MSSYAETFRRVLDGDYSDASDDERRQAIQEVIEMGAAASAAAAIQPFPLLDLVLISPIQIGMVQAIGRVHGHTLDKKSVLEILSTFGASILAQNLIVSSAKLVPFAGWVAAPAMAFSLTWAVGEVSDHYFRQGRGVEPDELRDMFKKAYKRKREEKVAAHQGNASLKERLAQLKEAFEAGILTEEEYEAKKASMLADF